MDNHDETESAKHSNHEASLLLQLKVVSCSVKGAEHIAEERQHIAGVSKSSHL